MKEVTKIVPKHLLIDWHRVVKEELSGISVRAIARATGLSEPTLAKYLSLNGKTFNVSIINTINSYRAHLREEAKKLTVN